MRSVRVYLALRGVGVLHFHEVCLLTSGAIFAKKDSGRWIQSDPFQSHVSTIGDYSLLAASREYLRIEDERRSGSTGSKLSRRRLPDLDNIVAVSPKDCWTCWSDNERRSWEKERRCSRYSQAHTKRREKLKHPNHSLDSLDTTSRRYYAACCCMILQYLVVSDASCEA